MTEHHSSNGTKLDPSLKIRTVGWDDLSAVTQLIYDVCEAEGDTSLAMTEDDLANEWKYGEFNPEQDAFLVVSTDGCPAGYAALFDVNEHCDLSGDIYVHPNFRGMGVESALLRAMEGRGREHGTLAAPGERVFIRVPLDNKDEAGKAIFVEEGFTPIRYHWKMEIQLDEAPPVPVIPDGLELRPFVQADHDKLVWQARNEAFKGNWGSHVLSFEEFSYFTFENPEYDPSLWSVIWDGDEVAGFCVNHNRMGIGWVHILGVRPAWRAKGLGLILLQLSFSEFYKRGMKTIGLAVDASNPTGATRLYRKAGMQTESEFVTLEKVLRGGSSES
jgi:mycothiol synthase